MSSSLPTPLLKVASFPYKVLRYGQSLIGMCTLICQRGNSALLALASVPRSVCLDAQLGQVSFRKILRLLLSEGKKIGLTNS